MDQSSIEESDVSGNDTEAQRAKITVECRDVLDIAFCSENSGRVVDERDRPVVVLRELFGGSLEGRPADRNDVDFTGSAIA